MRSIPVLTALVVGASAHAAPPAPTPAASPATSAAPAPSPPAAPAPSARPTPALAPGRFVYRYGSGALTLRRAPKGLAFSIQVVGGNAHTCALDGTIEGRTGRASSDVDDEPCTFTVEPVPGALRITPAEGEACRVYCGARASFDGDYQVPNPICTAEARRRFARLYAAKKLAEGRDLLRPVLEQCTDQLDPFEMMWVRNDLALGLHHLGDDAGCLAVLEPLRELADTDDDAPSGEPAYDEVRRRLAKATRTNLRLCGKPARL